MMDTRKLGKELSSYLSLFLEYVSCCPVMRNGEVIPPEQVAVELEDTMVSSTSSIGFFCDSKFSSGHFSHSILSSVVV